MAKFDFSEQKELTQKTRSALAILINGLRGHEPSGSEQRRSLAKAEEGVLELIRHLAPITRHDNSLDRMYSEELARGVYLLKPHSKKGKALRLHSLRRMEDEFDDGKKGLVVEHHELVIADQHLEKMKTVISQPAMEGSMIQQQA